MRNTTRKAGSRIGRYSLSNIVFNLFNYGILTLLTIICIYPILHVLFASVSDPTQLFSHRGLLLKPLGFTMQGYQYLFRDSSVFLAMGNTILYVAVGVFVSMTMTILGAYALSRRELMLKKGVMVIITFTMFFGGGLIPWYLTLRELGLYNNLWAMVLPSAINTWNLIVLRTGFQSVPYELEEAAIIDGASQPHILFRVILPLSKPVLAVIFLYYMVGKWNAWFDAMILLKERNMYPVQLLLREVLIQDTVQNLSHGSMDTSSVDVLAKSRELMKYCLTVVSSFPMLCIYPFLQKYFVKGMFVGSIKG